MVGHADFIQRLEAKVAEQLRGQRIGYLLGAGSSYLNGNGYPLASELWDEIKYHVTDTAKRDEIQGTLNRSDVKGIESALDLLDDGSAGGGEHRYLVSAATASLFRSLQPELDHHVRFVQRLHARSEPHVKIFNLNYDPIIERAAERAKVRLHDGFAGHEHAYFRPAMFEERIFRIRGTHKGRQSEETEKPLHLLKLHGSVGWYECNASGVRRCAFGSAVPDETKRLMIPPQRRKAQDTMAQPYAALWSTFRGSLGQDRNPLNRLMCIGYGFADEHVNTLIENALSRPNFTLLIFAKALTNEAWSRWSTNKNVIAVTEKRCSLKSEIGEGHPDLWNFETLAEKV